MSNIVFSDAQYAQLRATAKKWWSGELDRPMVPIITYGHPSSRKPSENPLMAFTTAWDAAITPEMLVDAHDWQMSTQRFHGEAFPYFPLTPFGPGALAAFLGCTPVPAPRTVWFMPPREDIPIEELHFEFDENNPHYRRVVNVLEAALEKWQGQVVIGSVDLGGILDILASFRGTENLLLDLYDAPEEVERCVKELQALWFVYFDKLNAMMAPTAQGYSHWYRLFSEEPGYMLQSDFCYMISPEMFDRFVAPELDSSAKRMKYAIYHMDGIGQIPHLPSLLAMDGLKGIQWVPGDGEPMRRDWSGLLSEILASGKKLVSQNQKPDGSAIDIVKNPGQLYFSDRYFAKDDPAARAYAARWGIELTED